jgi:hypothetical protein
VGTTRKLAGPEQNGRNKVGSNKGESRKQLQTKNARYALYPAQSRLTLELRTKRVWLNQSKVGPSHRNLFKNFSDNSDVQLEFRSSDVQFYKKILKRIKYCVVRKIKLKPGTGGSCL